ncbi:MAG: thioredoxin domain-containing protein [Desulfurococcales archaeon]|nr:thioredoxin domain-containing protein [Desulfurococcales archaeon]
MHKHKGLRMETPGRGRAIGVKHLLLAAGIITLFLALGQALTQQGPTIQAEAGQPNVIELMDKKPTLDDIISSKDKVVLFWEQKNCAGCKILRPYIYKAADKYPDAFFVKVHIDEIFKKDIDYGLKILQDYMVQGTPTLIVYVNSVETGRQVGLFPVDPAGGSQYKALLQFLDESLSKAPQQEEQANNRETTILGGPVKGLVLGLLAAFAPCSVPMIAAFASREARGSAASISVNRLTMIFMAVVGATLLLGFAMTLLYIASFAVKTVNPFAVAVVFAGAFIASWGALNLVGKEPMMGGGARSSILFPILGLQCSLPFLILAMTSITAEPVTVLLTGLAFAVGYSLPYIASAYGLKGITAKLSKAASSPTMLRLQGLILVAAGLYLIAETMPLGLVELG